MSTVYRTINTSFWTDPKVRQLAPDGKLLMLYLITCPHTNVGGIYYVPEIVVLHETGMKKNALDTLWNTLSKLGLVLRDHQTEVVWVVNMMKYQGRGEKVFAAAANQLLTLHNSPLVKKFLQRYPDVESIYRDKVSRRVSHGDSQFGNPDQESDKDSDQESDKGTAIRKAALAASDIAIPSEIDTPEVRDAVDRWLTHKRQIGKPYKSAETARHMFGDFPRAGPAAFVAAVNHSIGQNYQGIYAPSGSKNGTGKPNAGKQYDPDAKCDFA